MSPTDPTTEPASVQAPDLEAAADVLARVRNQGPLVHCLTNVVVTGWTANVLLAVGASPAMVENPEEAGELAAVAGGLLVNLGTMSQGRAEAARVATAAASDAGTPWVLDPVAVGVLGFRSRLAVELLTTAPAVVRGNPSEVVALGGGASDAKGVDSAADPADADEAVRALLDGGVGAVAVSGPVDRLTDAVRTVETPYGDPLLARVTGTGCALGALVAACLAVGAAPLDAAVAGTLALTVAAERAARACGGPGSFAVALLDHLHGLGAEPLPDPGASDVGRAGAVA